MIMRKHDEDYKEVGFIKKKVDGDYKDVQKIYRRDEDGNYRVIFERGYETEYDGANNFRVPAVGKNLKDYTIFGNSEQNGLPTPDSPIEPEFCGDLVSIELDEPLRAVGDYKDTLDLGTKTYTKRIQELVLTGEEREWTFDTQMGVKRAMLSPIVTGITGATAPGLSTHYEPDYGFVSGTFYVGRSNPQMLYINDDINALTYTRWFDFLPQQYAAGTPVKVWYVLKEPIVTTIPSIPDGMTGVVEGTGTQSGTPTPDNPIEPVFNGKLLPSGKYQVYTTYKIPILSGGVTKNIYLGQVQTTRRIKKIVLTGEETVALQSTNVFFIRFAGQPNSKSSTIGISNQYQSAESIAVLYARDFAYQNDSGYYRIRIHDSRFETPEDFKSYLAAQYAAGTPVTVWYVLATPEVGIVNEPLARIGDYADTINFSQAGVSIPTLPDPQTTLITIPTSVPPSEIIANYKAYKRPKYPPFLTKDGKTFDTKNGQSLYLGGYE